MNALLIGATGATGRDLLELLLKEEEIQQVDIFVRRAVDIKHNKLKIHVIDFNKPEEWRTQVKGDLLFSCLGTTLKAAGSKEAQWKIDHEYQYQFAKIAKENNVNNYVLISAANASTKSMFFYSRMKGQLEEDVKALQFSKTIIFNPPLLIRENTDRKMEVRGAKVIRFFNKLGLFRSQKPLPTKRLAEAMIKSVKVLGDGEYSVKGQEILGYV
ncbi:MAG: NAD(P)H-binding protein [Bacteroidota bacterium]